MVVFFSLEFIFINCFSTITFFISVLFHSVILFNFLCTVMFVWCDGICGKWKVYGFAVIPDWS